MASVVKDHEWVITPLILITATGHQHNVTNLRCGNRVECGIAVEDGLEDHYSAHSALSERMSHGNKDNHQQGVKTRTHDSNHNLSSPAAGHRVTTFQEVLIGGPRILKATLSQKQVAKFASQGRVVPDEPRGSWPDIPLADHSKLCFAKISSEVISSTDI